MGSRSNTIVVIVALVTIVAATTATICFWLTGKSNTSNFEQKVASSVKNLVQTKNYVQLLFVGDIMFDRGIRYYAQQNGGNDYIFDKISPALKENDLVVANLEGPITVDQSISSGTRPGSTNNYFFTFDPSVAKTLYKENIKMVDLGNNHILNFGYNGLDSTKKYLTDAKVDSFGAQGKAKSITKEISGVKITFVSYNQFLSSDSSAEQKSTIEEIKNAKKYSDIVIVFCHWGVEYATQPNQEQVSLGHQFVDGGADLVIGSHPHVVEPMEVDNGKRIYYSLGNFVFDQYFNQNVRNGLGVVVKINKNTKQLEFSEKHFYLQSGGQTIEKTAEK